MMTTSVRLMIVSVLFVFAAPIYSQTSPPLYAHSAVQVYHCEQNEDATDEQVEEVAEDWLEAARTMKGGEEMQAYLRFPVAADMGSKDFAFIVVAPSFEKWGLFTDGYENSPAETIDEAFDELADCPDSGMYEMVEMTP